MRVLVIEDHPIDLKLVHAVLETSGYEFDIRTSAEGAIEVIRASRPDVILLDLHLPGVDGLELVHELRQCADTRHIPILAVTAYSHRYPRSDVLAAGCTACIAKPIDTRELVNQLRDIAVRRPIGPSSRPAGPSI